MKKVVIVGATGMVGRVMLEVLEKRNFPIDTLYTVASENSINQEIYFKGYPYKVISIEEAISLQLDIALFSAGAEISKKWAPRFAKSGVTVIDNSSAWRMDPDKQLIVPEVNGNILSIRNKIIANPNCSTIQLVMILYPLHKKYNIKRVIVSTYQSVTGTGKKGIDQLESEISGIYDKKIYPYPIYKNVIPHCDIFEKEGYSKEELKLIQETQKILGDTNIAITATAARIPVIGGHSESVNITFKKKFIINEVRELLSNTPGVIVRDQPEKNIYPMPIHAHGKDEVFVGRIRRDFSKKNSLNLWIVADNLRKGAATNAIQIAEKVIKINKI